MEGYDTRSLSSFFSTPQSLGPAPQHSCPRPASSAPRCPAHSQPPPHTPEVRFSRDPFRNSVGPHPNPPTALRLRPGGPCWPYTSFESQVVATEGYAEALAALLPCCWVYAHVGAGRLGQQTPGGARQKRYSGRCCIPKRRYFKKFTIPPIRSPSRPHSSTKMVDF